MRTKKLSIFLILTGLLVAGSASMPSAEARWFGKKQKTIETYEAPPKESLEENCSPYQRKLERIHKKSKLSQALMQPRVEYLMRRNNHCTEAYMEQELWYLKHVDIQRAPGEKPAPTGK